MSGFRAGWLANAFYIGALYVGYTMWQSNSIGWLPITLCLILAFIGAMIQGAVSARADRKRTDEAARAFEYALESAKKGS
jgi:hypothetical protein